MAFSPRPIGPKARTNRGRMPRLVCVDAYVQLSVRPVAMHPTLMAIQQVLTRWAKGALRIKGGSGCSGSDVIRLRRAGFGAGNDQSL
jgi:hypothetical protein